MNNFSEKQQEENIDIKKFIFKIITNWYWFVISIFITFTIAYLINRYTEPIYSVNSALIVRDDQKGKGLSGAENLIDGLEIFKSTKNVHNEIGILKSFDLSLRTIEELDFGITSEGLGRIKNTKLYKNAPIIVDVDTSFNQLKNYPVYISILSNETYKLEINEDYDIQKTLRFGEKFSCEQFRFTISLRDSSIVDVDDLNFKKLFFYINDKYNLARGYRNKLGITLNDKKGSILTLTIQGYNAQQEIDYLNKLGEVYIRSGLEEKNQIATNTIMFIDEQLNDVTDSLRVAEMNLQNFRLSNKIFNLSKEGNLLFEKIEKFQNEKNILLLKEKYYIYLSDYLTKKKDLKELIAPSTIGINDNLLNSTIKNLNDLYIKKEELLFSAQENNPGINLIDRQIQKSKATLVENLKNIIETNTLSINDANKQISDVEQKIRKLPINERKLINIERKFNLNDDIYTYLLEKRAEAGIAKASNIADNKILDIARPQNVIQISPRTSLSYMVALVLGLIIPLIFIIIFDYFNNRINERKDIENNTRIPIIGSIGHNNINTDTPVFENPKSSISESFRALRTNLQYLLIKNSQKVITISSIISGEGKTFCAINLASILAMANKKTILIGLDLRKPKIHMVFDIYNESGISTFLINKTSIDELIKATSIENLFLINSGPMPPNPAELIETDNMRILIEKLKEKFDYIIIDTPPIAIVTDALLLTKYSDCNIIVVRQNYSHKNSLNLINDLYESKNIENMNLVINDIKTSNYGYYDYNYGYGYGNYYQNYGNDYYDNEPKISSLLEKIRSLFSK